MIKFKCDTCNYESDSFKVENLTRFDVAKKLIELKEVEKNNNRNLFIDGYLTEGKSY